MLFILPCFCLFSCYFVDFLPTLYILTFCVLILHCENHAIREGIIMDNLQDILYQFGLYRSRRIYWYIYTTVELAYQSPHLLEELTRDLYPAAALRCGCSSAAIERGIRAAIARAWDVNPALFSQLACRKITQPPTAGDFFCILCHYLPQTATEE